MNRGYQYNFSTHIPSMYDVQSRERKAHTMIAVLSDFFKDTDHLKDLTLIDIGASTGIIDNYLSGYFKQVVGVDIDSQGISHARKFYGKENLTFIEGDAMSLQFEDNSFDIVICSQVYEHVPDAQKMLREIYRVLKPAGVCFFSAGNRLNPIEPHYNLPLLSIIPKSLSHFYLKLSGKGNIITRNILAIGG